MSDSSGASSHLQSTLASSDSGEKRAAPLTWVMSFGNIGGANLFSAVQGMAGKTGLTAAFGWLGNSFGLKNMAGGDKLAKSPMGKPLGKKAKPLGSHNFGMAADGPSISPPSIGSPKAPGGTGQTL